MNHLGIEVNIKNAPVIDRGFIPLNVFNKAFLGAAKKPFGIAVTRNEGQVSTCNTFIHGTPDMRRADEYYIDRLIKTCLWWKGGYKLTICGDEHIYQTIKHAYSPNGSRAFDSGFMSRVYERPFEIELVETLPQTNEFSRPIGRHLEGFRIGFDAGGSDRKVSAVIDGVPVFSEEVVWRPKTSADPDYHFSEIVNAFRSAADHLPRVDAIGISSAGIFINNRTMVASLFLCVPENLFNQKVKDIYIRASKEIGEIPTVVCNDGDVTALAGAMSLNKNNVLGLAMGTSEAAGFVDEKGNITGWLNELAFAPIDANPDATRDEWSGDIGCGVKYFSQEGVIRLAESAGIVFNESQTAAEKLKTVQSLLISGDKTASLIFSDIGVYLGHTLAYYFSLYSFSNVLLLGRVMSGEGGDLILNNANLVLQDEYPDIASKIVLLLPDENSRRVGQSVAAASLPEI